MNIIEGVDLTGAAAAPEQPGIWEFETNDRVFVKQMHIAKAGTVIPQHSHSHDHSSLLAFGAARIWKDGVLDADHYGPKILWIEAGVKHLFQSLIDNTVIYCIHNLMSYPDGYKILDEHKLSLEKS